MGISNRPVRGSARRIVRKAVPALAALSMFAASMFAVGGVAAAGDDSRDRQFAVFSEFFKDLSAGLEETFGAPFFTGLENRGGGEIQITATEIWLNSPRKGRNATSLHARWKRINRPLPVKIIFIDERERPRAVIEDGPQGPRFIILEN